MRVLSGGHGHRRYGYRGAALATRRAAGGLLLGLLVGGDLRAVYGDVPGGDDVDPLFTDHPGEGEEPSAMLWCGGDLWEIGEAFAVDAVRDWIHARALPGGLGR